MKRYSKKILFQNHFFPILGNKDYNPDINIRLRAVGVVTAPTVFQINQYINYDKPTFDARMPIIIGSSVYRAVAVAQSAIFQNNSPIFRRYLAQINAYNPVNQEVTITLNTFAVPLGTELELEFYDIYSPAEGDLPINGVVKFSGTAIALQFHAFDNTLYSMAIGANLHTCRLPYVNYSTNGINLNIAQFVNNL